MKDLKTEYPYNIVEALLRVYGYPSPANRVILTSYKYIIENIEHNWDCILDTLTPREAMFITLHYKDNKTLQEIAKLYDLTKERVRQVINKGLRRIYHYDRICLLTVPKETLNAYKIVKEQIDEEIAKLKQELHQIKTDGINYITNITKSISIEELRFSTRSYNALKNAKIDTLNDLISHTIEEIACIRNLGYKSLKEICMKLHEEGYKLKGYTSDDDYLYGIINDEDNE